MPRILAVADEVVRGLDTAHHDHRPDVIVACGDLPTDYLEDLASGFAAPLVYVPGNHDPTSRSGNGFGRSPRPRGCTSIDGRIVDAGGVRVAGLGGSVRYRPGANQYTEAQMRRRALALEVKGRVKRLRDNGAIDVLATHAPPLGVGDEDDPPHRGFKSFHRLVANLSPRILVHGHVHRYGRARPDRHMGQTLVINAVGHRFVEIDT